MIYTKTITTIPHIKQLISREDPRPLMTVSSAIMIVVLFAKVNVLYPRVVISSLAKNLEKHHFCYSYTSFSVWLRDNYMPL
jgi:hypothetical protein